MTAPFSTTEWVCLDEQLIIRHQIDARERRHIHCHQTTVNRLQLNSPF